MRKLVQWCVLLLLAAMLVETLLVGGLAVPYRVVGGSMAGALLGTHRDVACGDCGCRFPCGTDVRPAPAWAVCPNCGYAANALAPLPQVAADRVLVDRAAFSIRAPRRWEVAAFRRPEEKRGQVQFAGTAQGVLRTNWTCPLFSSQADALLVKRIVGLPGERIELRHGDVYADRRIQRKTLLQQRALAVLVHDADCTPTREPLPLPRWRAKRSDSRWEGAAGRFTHTAKTDHEPVDWLVYHHDGQSAVTDVCSYNASRPRRAEDVHAVADLMLSFRLNHLSGQGALYVRITDGRDGLEAQLQFNDRQRHRGTMIECATACLQAVPGGNVATCTTGKQAVAHCRVPVSDDERLVEVSLFDRQFLLAVDGRALLTWPLERSAPPETPSCPLAIGAQGLNVTISHLRVYRDVYYGHPIGLQGGRRGVRPVRLAADEYYVLGDNSPISEDSRTWPDPATIDAKWLIGKPLVAIPSVVFPFGGHRYFQVPNPAGIRYIR